MTIDKTLTVDLNRVQPHKVIKIHEGDVNSVFLVLTVTKDGESVSLSGLTIKYDATIAGFLAEQDASGSVSSNTIRIPITKNMTAIPGTLKIDIKMISGTQILYTQTVTMIVEKAVIDEGTIIDFDGTTIGKRLDDLEEGFLDVKTVVRALNAKFPIEADDIKDNEVIKVKKIASDDETVNAAVDNFTAYGVSLEGRSNLMFCVNSGTNLRAQVRFDTLGYMKYRAQSKDTATGEWNPWTDWSLIASNMNIANGAVTSTKIADGSVSVSKLADKAVATAKLADKAVSTAKIADAAVTQDKLSLNAVGKDELIDGSVTTSKLADKAVTENKIDDYAVTADKLASGSVTTQKIAGGAVTTLKLSDSTVTANKLSPGAVTTEKLSDGAVTSDKIAANAVTLDKIPNEEITAAKLAPGSVTTAQIEFNAVTTAEIADGAVTSAKIAPGAISYLQIADDSITASKLSSGCVETDAIDNNAVTDVELADNAVTTAKIADSAVTAAKIADGVIPTKTSDLRNDSGYVSDLSEYMRLAHTTTSEDSGQFYLERVGLSLNAVNLYLALYNSDSKRVAWYSDIPDTYTKDEIDTVFMELAPDTIPSSLPNIADGQLFRMNGILAIKIGSASDFIEIAKLSDIPTKTSELQNDSGFLTTHQDISDLMKYAPVVNSGQQVAALHPGQLFLYQSEVCIKTDDDYIHIARLDQIPSRTSELYNDSGFLTEHQDISGKADIETGTIPSNHAWYTEESDGYTMVGDYSIVGDMCFLRATAHLIQGWERVYYSLPVAAVTSGSTIALQYDNFFSVATGFQSNISVLEIRQINSQYMSGGGTISFTLVYKCR